MTTTGAAGKRKRVSKNKKKSWRKHSDVKDVEEFMEDQRMQERTGGLVAEKKNEELFFMEKKVKNEDDSPVPRKRRKREPKPLKCHSLLQGDPRIKPVRLTVHEKTNNVKRKCPQIQEKILTGALSKKQTVGLEQRKQAKQKRVTKFMDRRKTHKSDYDLWDTDNQETTDTIDEHYLKVAKKFKPKSPSLYLKKPSGLPAVEVAHPGASYNPSYVQHQELLQKALIVEIVKDKKEKRIERALDAKFPTLDQAPTMETWLQEMGSGLFEDEKEDTSSEKSEDDENSADDSSGEHDSDNEDSDRLSVNPAVRREDKKTVKQRRKINEKKEKEKKMSKEKKVKINKNELFRLKSIKRGVKEREDDLKKRLAKKAELEEKYKDNPKKLGKLKYEEPSLEIKLSGEVEGSLRLLKPEGHLLKDRFKSLQKRNMLETRERTKVVKKYKPKLFDRKSHRDITE